MRFSNPIPDFMENKKRKWYVHYTCETISPLSTGLILYGLGAIAVVATVGYFAFTFGQKKGAESKQGNSSGAYGALGANNTYMMHEANPTYGNPFARNA